MLIERPVVEFYTDGVRNIHNIIDNRSTISRFIDWVTGYADYWDLNNWHNVPDGVWYGVSPGLAVRADRIETIWDD